MNLNAALEYVKNNHFDEWNHLDYTLTVYTVKEWFNYVYEVYEIKSPAIRFFDIWTAYDSLMDEVIPVYYHKESNKYYMLNEISLLYKDWLGIESLYFKEHPCLDDWAIVIVNYTN